eukprot:Tamp_16422.p1 GENE.Tamp_16422~~Tamp_16422.p1  ORF type:complete len:394 (-),score=122.05 Tamp_16422:284-1435(-)
MSGAMKPDEPDEEIEEEAKGAGGSTGAESEGEGTEGGGAGGEEEQDASKAADVKKKLDKEEKARLAAEAKAQKEEQKAQEKAEKDERKRLKEEERKSRPPKERMPKDQVQKYLQFLSYGNLAAAIAALVVMILAYQETTRIHDALSDAMAIHCASNSLLSNCLILPELVFAPFVATLAWSIVLLVAALMLCQGAFSGNSTASLTGFIYISAMFILLQIVLGSVILATFDDFKGFVNKSLSCDTDAALQSTDDGCQRPLNPRWAADLANTVEELWDSSHITESSWIGKLGCNAEEHPAYAEGGASCFLSKLRKLTTMVACMLLTPIVVQAPAIWFALQLRWWVGEERGQDLFAHCRLPHSCSVCIMAGFLFALLFGVIVSAIPA